MVTTKDEILVYDEIYLYFDMVDFLHDKYEKILNDVKEKIKEPQKPNVYRKKMRANEILNINEANVSDMSMVSRKSESMVSYQSRIVIKK